MDIGGGTGLLQEFRLDAESMDFLSSNMMQNMCLMQQTQTPHIHRAADQTTTFDMLGGFNVPLGPTIAPAGDDPTLPTLTLPTLPTLPKRKTTQRRGPAKKRRIGAKNNATTGEKNEAQLSAHRKIEQKRRSRVAALQAELRACVLRSDPNLAPENVTTKAQILKAAITHFEKSGL